MSNDGGQTLLEKWGSVAAIRDYYASAKSNFRDVVREERQALKDEEEATVAAFKAERKEARKVRERQRQRERRAAAAAA